jgi:hypothetical protein
MGQSPTHVQATHSADDETHAKIAVLQDHSSVTDTWREIGRNFIAFADSPARERTPF